MKPRTLTLIALLSYSVMLVIPAKSLAGEGIFFTYTTAQRLYVDMESCKQERNLCAETEKLLTDKSNDLIRDKEIFRQEAEQYKAAYEDADQKRVKAETNRPSRMTWFGAGVLVTLAAILGITISQ